MSVKIVKCTRAVTSYLIVINKNILHLMRPTSFLHHFIKAIKSYVHIID